MTRKTNTQLIAESLKDPVLFARRFSKLRLRSYQTEVARAIVDSVVHARGDTFAVMFPRQSGKNELQAQIEAYLLTLFQHSGAEIIKISPTREPQSLNAMRRLEKVLDANPLTRSNWVKESGYIYRLGKARVLFLSGAPEANIVGATASTLLQVDEAQDVSRRKYDKDIAPMAASTNATRVFWGTAWTSRTLLARELEFARQAQRKDGRKRVFIVNADAVSREVPAYGEFVRAQTALLGRSHPMVRTQFYCEPIDSEGSLFHPERRARMLGTHRSLLQPQNGLYAMLLDVAGEDEGRTGTGELAHPNRDATALTLVEVDCSAAGSGSTQAPVYKPVLRREFLGLPHTELRRQLMELARAWNVRHVVVDATGVGAGLCGMLQQELPGKVLPFTFSAQSKSKLGWDFLALIDSGRWQEPAEDLSDGDRTFQRQLECCTFEVSTRPGQQLRWGVPDGTTHPDDGALVRDDLLMSAALATRLDTLSWSVSAEPLIVPAPDPLRDLDQGF